MRSTASTLLVLTVLALTGLPIHADEQIRSTALSPDKAHIVREVQQADGVILELVDVASGQSKPLVRLPGENRWPVWSPDGLFVAFCAQFHQRLFITVTDMTGHSWLVQEIQGGLTRISWSPDAVWLVYSTQVSPGNRDLVIASAGGTDIRNLTNTPQLSEDEAVWSTHLNRIDYRVTTQGNSHEIFSFLTPFTVDENSK